MLREREIIEMKSCGMIVDAIKGPTRRWFNRVDLIENSSSIPVVEEYPIVWRLARRDR